MEKSHVLRNNTRQLENVVTLKEIWNLWQFFVLIAYQGTWRKMKLMVG